MNNLFLNYSSITKHTLCQILKIVIFVGFVPVAWVKLLSGNNIFKYLTYQTNYIIENHNYNEIQIVQIIIEKHFQKN